MKTESKNKGSIMLVAIFAIALLSTLVIGMLQMNIEEIQLMQNQVYAIQATTLAEAGLNDAFNELRTNSGWTIGFTDKPFTGGLYTVTVEGALPTLTVESVGTSSQGFAARVTADITVGDTSPYVIRVDNLRVNE